MGIFRKKETHESRSSSMSYVLRWKKENVRQAGLVAIFLIALTIMISILMYTQSKKQVFFVIDGKASAVETRESKLQNLLNEHSISLQPHDTISMPVNGAIKDGDRVIIKRANQVKVTSGNETKKLYTTENTVEGAIRTSGYKLSSNDKVYPALGASVSSNMHIKIVRVKKQQVEQKKQVPYQVIKTSDPSLYKGDNRVLQSGKSGVVVQRVQKIYHDGKLVSKQLINKEVTQKRVDKVIAIGTKKKPVVLAASVSPDTAKATRVSSGNAVRKAGVNFKYSKVLQNFSMTAYSSQEAGIGTRTASGTRVTEGRTIAVDPSIIPIGWWVYIEGVGFRRAEDTGGAIKGHKIDVYYESLSRANQFGRKYGKTVYVIGPVKPEIN
ncbi:G5 domain-containing protein [Paenibacillus farraposensis]|uniref:G5 domain-containing protein n=1 Tax=Paenibacillus farraposensis TaxID=2807095 RepID=A0ABW4DFW5_9BACL|nr:3D domain-containing protein [Paenibacillus farraposensis]MCC3380832.1 G5 domain-containing protein [Paenibacillus farraposensis]